MRLSLFLFSLVISLALISVAFAKKKEKGGRGGGNGKGGGHGKPPKPGKVGSDAAAIHGNKDGDEKRKGRKKHRTEVRTKSDKVRDRLCEKRMEGKRMTQSLKCGDADNMADAIYCINSKIAKEKHVS